MNFIFSFALRVSSSLSRFLGLIISHSLQQSLSSDSLEGGKEAERRAKKRQENEEDQEWKEKEVKGERMSDQKLIEQRTNVLSYHITTEHSDEAEESTPNSEVLKPSRVERMPKRSEKKRKKRESDEQT